MGVVGPTNTVRPKKNVIHCIIIENAVNFQALVKIDYTGVLMVVNDKSTNWDLTEKTYDWHTQKHVGLLS